VDRLIEEARFEVDAKKRQAFYHKVQGIIRNDVPFLWMHNQVVVTGVRKNVKGVQFQEGTEAIILRNAHK
jgi:ABC-type transport system substrate-binding protein